jgi:hypothetical protein
MKTTIRIDQMRLVSAISLEVARQYPGVTVDSDRFNVIIAAANSVKAAYDGTEVDVTPSADEPDWSMAELRDCAGCGAERVATLHDATGEPKCEDCYASVAKDGE